MPWSRHHFWVPSSHQLSTYLLPRPYSFVASGPFQALKYGLQTQKKMSSTQQEIQKGIDQVSGDPESLYLVYQSHPRWPIQSSNTTAKEGKKRVHIAILDSSFNPPHFAHLAIASSHFPLSLSSTSSSPAIQLSETGDNLNRVKLDKNDAMSESYTSRILLFSVKNIEKKPKPGDASTLQRIEMTILLAERLSKMMIERKESGGVAVGLINEPTFVKKSHIVQNFLKSHQNEQSDVRLSFLAGTDTLARFFVPKFYPSGMQQALSTFFSLSPEGDGSHLVIARRGKDQTGRFQEDQILQQDEVKQWVEMGGLRMLGEGEIGYEEVGSTEVREAVKNGEKLDGMIPHEIEDYIREAGLYTQ